MPLVVQQTQHMLVSQFRSQATKCYLMMVLILYLSLKYSLHLYVDILNEPSQISLEGTSENVL